MKQIRQILRYFKSLRALDLFQPSLKEVLHRFEQANSLEDQSYAVEQLVAWLRLASPVEGDNEQIYYAHQARRLDFLLQKLVHYPNLGRAVGRALCTLLIETDPVPLLTQTGLRHSGGFFGEALDRVLFRLLPRPTDEKDLADLFGRLFKEEFDSVWIRHLEPSAIDDLLSLICPEHQAKARMHAHLVRGSLDSLVLLGVRIAALALDPEVRMRSNQRQLSQSPFLALNAHLTRTRESGLSETLPVHLAACEHHIRLCREQVRDVFNHLEAHGVSINLVYQLEQLEQLLKRCESLIHLLTPQDAQHSHPLALFVADLIESHFAKTRLRELIGDNIHLISRKVAERTGASGEHYIARSRAEYFDMLRSAAGGGIVTVGTTVMKFAITALHPALFFEGLFFTLIYAGSFLLMQACHFALATKQPSMTAPALAGRLRELKDREQLMDFVLEIARITRSQFAAAIGNIGLVVPGALIFDTLHVRMLGRHVLSSAYAEKTLLSLHPLQSLTVPYAILTGILLWLGSISAGWVENWTVYRRLPEAINQSGGLRRVFGEEAAKKTSDWFVRNISGIAGNVFFGAYLGFIPTFGRFFGLPLDVRHVTLSAGTLTFALCAMDLQTADASLIVFACLGILIIGLFNFGVSFALALYVAMKARKIKSVWLSHLASSLLAHFRVKPLDFFFPVDEGPPAKRGH